ncbi:TAXI family TRAP transporter solute-binding subunit [Novosphingobium sp. RL4]|uniref:TAXI family TRAP transporter solute-binding subunit n=1 Tax=Novosphingobium sp. RL4 TaxID=3109595 RepID=UPI002D780DCE|nr:TAXI family TRAP transporter solute-binding subunit [Novosphingobium sp. RL4]WRT94411.1 TAXI family TRAP transporter solute-binding subunit [Novosphingobium sp. RL4]
MTADRDLESLTVYFHFDRTLSLSARTTQKMGEYMQSPGSPSIDRSVTLNFVGDWGQANFHRICSWLCQEFSDRAGLRSRVAIWNTRGGGLEGPISVFDGEAQLCITTPAMLVGDALVGEGIFSGNAMPTLRALGVLPQNDRLVLAIDPKFGVSTFEELRAKKPNLRIAASVDDGTNYIGYVSQRYMEAHGIDEATLKSWGGEYVVSQRPEQSIARMVSGEVDAVLQEAIMTPWWREAMSVRNAVALPAEEQALAVLKQNYGFRRNSLPAGYWDNLPEAIDTLDFSDFVILVRDDMPDDIAHLLAWCLVETRGTLEAQYRHIPPERSPLSYPLDPFKMADTPVPLHPGAERYYREAGYI